MFMLDNSTISFLFITLFYSSFISFSYFKCLYVFAVELIIIYLPLITNHHHSQKTTLNKQLLYMITYCETYFQIATQIVKSQCYAQDLLGGFAVRLIMLNYMVGVWDYTKSRYQSHNQDSGLKIYTSLMITRNINIKHYKILGINQKRLPVSVGQSLYLQVTKPKKIKEDINQNTTNVIIIYRT